MYQILRLIIVVAYLFKVSTILAPTWNHCHCSWESWRSWTTCSEVCGGGIQNRSRRVWHDANADCDGFDKCASNDEGLETRICNTSFCYNGGTFEQSKIENGTCHCPPGTTGFCCELMVQSAEVTTDKNPNVSALTEEPIEVIPSPATGENQKETKLTDEPSLEGMSTITDEPSMEDMSTITDEPSMEDMSTITDEPSMEDMSTITDEPPMEDMSTITDEPSQEVTTEENSDETKLADERSAKEQSGIDVTGIAIGVSCSIASIALTVLAALVVCSHLNKRRNEAYQRNVEVSYVCNFVNIPIKQNDIENS